MQGTPSNTTVTKTYGETLGTLPTVTRTGYTFTGWFTAPMGGTQISTSTTAPANNVTYYAHWKDETAPTVTISPTSATTCKSKSVKITVSDSGSKPSINNNYQYCISTSNTHFSEGDQTVTWIAYTPGTAFSIGSEVTGTYYLWVRSIWDNAENMASPSGAELKTIAWSGGSSTYYVLGPYVFDNTSPSIGVGTTYTYDVRQNKTMTRSNAITTADNASVTYPGWTDRDFIVNITTNEALSSLQYKIGYNYDNTTYDSYSYTPLASGSWTSVTANSTKNSTVTAFADTSDVHTSHQKVYVKAVDSAGNVTYISQKISIYNYYGVFVAKAYLNSHERLPDESGLEGFSSMIRSGIVSNNFSAYTFVNWSRFSTGITSSQKIKALAGAHRGIVWSNELISKNLSAEEFVTIVYRTVLLRDPDSGGLTTWVNQINKSGDMLDAFYGIASSSEAIGKYDSSYGL